MAVVGAGHVAYHAVPVQNRFFSHDDGIRVVQRHAAELAVGSFGADFGQRGAADEIAFGHAHGETDASLVGIVLGVDVLAPKAVALFEPQRIEGAAAGCDHAKRLARLPEDVPQAQALFERGVKLPAELAGVRDTQGQRGNLGNRNSLGGEVGEGRVAHVVFADAAEQVAGARPPQADAAQCGRNVGQGDRAVAGKMALHPAQIVEAHAAAGYDHEALLTEAGDGQVAFDSAAGGQHGGVRDGSDRSVHVVGCQTLQSGERGGAGHLEDGEGCQIEQGHPFAGCGVFGCDGRRPFLRCPAAAVCPGYVQRTEQIQVGLVPLGTFPSRVLEEDGAQLLLARMEWGEPQIAGVGHLLARVDDVVDLAVLLGGAGADVGAAEGVGMEAADVALVQVGCGLPFNDPFGDRFADAACVGDPDGLGGPEAGQVGGFAEHGKAVVGEGEDSVERACQPHTFEAGHQFTRCGHGGLKVGGGEWPFRRGQAVHGLVWQVGGVQQEGFVLVGADADAFSDLAEVHRLVLVAQKRERNLLGGAGQFRYGVSDGVEVLHWRERDGHASHAADLGRPDAGGGDDEVGLDVAMGGLHGGDAAGGGAETGHFDAAEELGAGLFGRARHRLC